VRYVEAHLVEGDLTPEQEHKLKLIRLKNNKSKVTLSIVSYESLLDKYKYKRQNLPGGYPLRQKQE